jgi:hypothetical protein
MFMLIVHESKVALPVSQRIYAFGIGKIVWAKIENGKKKTPRFNEASSIKSISTFL